MDSSRVNPILEELTAPGMAGEQTCKRTRARWSKTNDLREVGSRALGVDVEGECEFFLDV